MGREEAGGEYEAILSFEANMKNWTLVGIVIEGRPVNIHGVNPWKHEWVSLKEPRFEVPHPDYPNQRHKIWAYTITAGDRDLVFAAGEYSNGVWGFYVPSS